MLFARIVARIKHFGFQLLRIVFGIMYFEVISEGWRICFPMMAKPLWRSALFAALRGYEETRNLDFANLAALALFLLVSLFLEKAMDMCLHPGQEDENTRNVVILLATTLLGVDAWMFFQALGQLGWSSGKGSSTEIAATIGWVAMLVASSVVSVNLRRKVLALSGRRYL